jgi:hypothetical protein
MPKTFKIELNEEMVYEITIAALKDALKDATTAFRDDELADALRKVIKHYSPVDEDVGDE